MNDESARFGWSHSGETSFAVQLDDALIKGHVFVGDDIFHVFLEGVAFAFEWQNLMTHAGDVEHEGRFTAPMPGKVIAVLVEGASVEKGAPLMVMEAMKMEHVVVAPATGKIGEILFEVGDQVVADGAQLLMLEVGQAA